MPAPFSQYMCMSCWTWLCRHHCYIQDPVVGFPGSKSPAVVACISSFLAKSEAVHSVLVLALLMACGGGCLKQRPYSQHMCISACHAGDCSPTLFDIVIQQKQPYCMLCRSGLKRSKQASQHLLLHAHVCGWPNTYKEMKSFSRATGAL